MSAAENFILRTIAVESLTQSCLLLKIQTNKTPLFRTYYIHLI